MPPPRHRTTIEWSKQSHDGIRALMEKHGARSYPEFFERTATFYDAVKTIFKKGGKLVYVKDGKQVEVEFPTV